MFDEGAQSTVLSFDGTTVALADDESSTNGFSSHVKIYRNFNMTWSPIGQKISVGVKQNMGKALAMSADGSVIAVGLLHIRAFLFDDAKQRWVQIGNDIDATDAIAIAQSAHCVEVIHGIGSMPKKLRK